MTWVFSVDGTPNNSVNTAPATGARAVWTWVACLLQAGWTKKADSDGTTYSATGVQVTSGASGAGGLGNNSAWVRLQDPAGVREICIQRGTTDLVWRAKWSHSAKFTGGSPGATQTPAATDEQIINGVGGGTNSSPTYTTIFGTNNAYKFHCGADNAAPYDWYWVACDNTTAANPRGGRFYNMMAGTYPSEDAAPYIVEFGGSGTSIFSSVVPKGSGYYKKGLSGEAWVGFYMLTYFNVRQSPTYYQVCPATNGSSTGAMTGNNPYNGMADILPCPIVRCTDLSTQVGWKGLISPDSYGLVASNVCPVGTVWTVDDNSKAFCSISGNGHALRWPVGVAQVL